MVLVGVSLKIVLTLMVSPRSVLESDRNIKSQACQRDPSGNGSAVGVSRDQVERVDDALLQDLGGQSPLGDGASQLHRADHHRVQRKRPALRGCWVAGGQATGDLVQDRLCA